MDHTEGQSMGANLRWKPSTRTLTLIIEGVYTLDECKQVNALVADICARDDFDYGYLVVDLSQSDRPNFTPVDGIRHTNSFRENDLRGMYVTGLNRRLQMIGSVFVPIIEGAVGMQMRFVGTPTDAAQLINMQQQAASR